MCGIFALLANDLVSIDDIKSILESIDRRGHDYSSPLLEQATNCVGLWLRLKSSVLHLRGDECQRQPVIDMHGNILMFNGQIYKYSGEELEKHQSDTAFLADKLQSCRLPEEVVEIFTEIEGPFAFIYWHHRLKKLFYGRDVFGRKSLCALMDANSKPLILSSIAEDKLETHDLKWHEVSCSGLHCVDFSQREQVKKLTFLWNLNSIYPTTSKCESTFHYASGGHQLQLRHLKPLNDEQIEPGNIDEMTKIKVLKQFEDVFIEAVSSRYRYNRSTCLKCRKSQDVDSVKQRCHHPKVAVAFSGGIDSTLIALALDKVVDKREIIDLITVAFKPDSPDRDSVGCAFKEIKQLSPDRKWQLVLCDTTKADLQFERDFIIRQLILPCDTVFDDGIGCACWFIGQAFGRSILSSVTDEWMKNHFENFLEYNPTSSGLDPEITLDYRSPASMLFVGSSIDEQLGGYSSHRKAWSESGHAGLYQEVSFLMRRLSSRNLGRDDRAYCDHGRDLKLPFLDFQFVSFLNELPLGLKMNLDEPLDRGPKKILRELALAWGLKETSRRIKRAMQFGTRIANLEGTKERGDDVCLRLRQSNMTIKKSSPVLEELVAME